MAKLKSWVTGK